MSPISYSDVFAIDFEREYEEEIFPGALVRTGQNLYPHFQVVAVFDEKAWVRNMETGADHIASARCLRIIQRPCGEYTAGA